jgi:uncharacterized protein RhaS with RHS repeats
MKTKTNTLLIVVALLAYWLGPSNASAFYDPGQQRWLNRDPIAEKGGINLFRFVRNSCPNNFDSNGEDIGVYGGGTGNQNNPIYFPTSPYAPGASDCRNASPENSTSTGCASYGNDQYMGVSLKCFCQNAPDDDWSKAVRGCLMCMRKKGIPTEDAHFLCYDFADQKYKQPTSQLIQTWAKCAVCKKYSN